MDVSGQKYKVFFNQVLVLIEESITSAKVKEELLEVSDSDLFLPENWENWLARNQSLTVRCSCDRPFDVFNRFKSHFKLVEAAGGIVKDEVGDVLVIYRNGKWDLPKGKLEKGEEINECAVREVEEETAVSVFSCSETNFDITYHVYFHKNTFVIKSTHWYIMKSKTNVQNLLPQTDEGIDKVEWIRQDKVLELFKENSYRSIVALVEKYLSFQID